MPAPAVQAAVVVQEREEQAARARRRNGNGGSRDSRDRFPYSVMIDGQARALPLQVSISFPLFRLIRRIPSLFAFYLIEHFTNSFIF